MTGDGAGQGDETVEEGRRGDTFAGVDRRKCQNPAVRHLGHFRKWRRARCGKKN